MADIFISYSQQDRDQARLLAAFLESEGYSVWWDSSLLSGDNFRKSIMTELGRARAAIVIWTKNSVASDWVQSEAGRAHADRKLIPLKTKGLEYKDIPPPFDNMHIESLGERDKVLAAVTAQLAKPAQRDGLVSAFAKRTRFELLSWVGIIGTIITLTSNLQSILTLARWVRSVVQSWTEIVTVIWRHVLFFMPTVYAPDALFLTFFSFIVLSAATSLRRRTGPTPRYQKLSALLAFLVVIAIFLAGLSQSMQTERGESYFTKVILDPFWYRFAGRLQDLDMGWVMYVLVPLLLAAPFLICISVAMLLYWIVRSVTPYRLDASALSLRLWRSILGVALVLSVNYLALWVER